MRWLDESSRAAVVEALRAVAPQLHGSSIRLSSQVAGTDPVWWAGSAIVDDRWVAKFAWSRPAGLRLAHEIDVLTALRNDGEVPFLPEVVAASRDPVLLVTRRVPGASLFEIAEAVDAERAGDQLARFLAALRRRSVREAVEATVGPLSTADEGVQHPAATEVLRERLGTWVRSDQYEAIRRWCDWADAVLARAAPTVLAHADFHGDNQVWEDDRLRVVVDFETVCAAEPEYDLRALPGTGPGVRLLTATMGRYRRLTGSRLSVDRVMAWHLRTVLWDVLWRSEAGIPQPGRLAPAAQVDRLAERLDALDIGIERR